MGKTHFPRLDIASASDERYIRDGVVRCAERAGGDEGVVALKFAGDRVNLRGFQTFGQREGRQNGRQAFGHHALSAARTSHQQKVVTTGGRHFKSPLRHLLPFHVLEVVGEAVLGSIKLLSGINHGRSDEVHAFQMLDHLAEVAGAKHLEGVDHGGFAGIFFGNENRFIAQTTRQNGRRQHAPHRP